jgi:two-component system, NarL family, nitrate/nitrite response regulator NarL
MSTDTRNGIDWPVSVCLVASALLTVAEALGAYLRADAGMDTRYVEDRGALDQALAARDAPDLALVDFDLPGLSGLSGALEVVSLSPRTKIVVMTETSLRYTSARLIGAGAAGVVTRAMPAAAIKVALDLVMTGEVFAPREVLPLLEGYGELREVGRISEQEQMVLRGLCDGRTNADIAAQNGMTELAVQSMVRSLCTRMKVTNRTQVALAALTAGLV